MVFIPGTVEIDVAPEAVFIPATPARILVFSEAGAVDRQPRDRIFQEAEFKFTRALDIGMMAEEMMEK